MPRTHTFGKIGAHGGLYFDDHLAPMLLSNKFIDWSKQNLSYLLKKSYAATMRSWIQNAVEFVHKNTTTLADYCNNTLLEDSTEQSDLLVTYDRLDGNGTSFVRYADELKPMMNGIVMGHAPRASYDGIVVVRCRGRRLFLRPKP